MVTGFYYFQVCILWLLCCFGVIINDGDDDDKETILLLHFASPHLHSSLCSTRYQAQYTPPTPTRRNSFVASRRRRRCALEFATSSRRLPTDSAMWTQPMPWPSLQFCSQCYRSRIWRNIWRCMFVNIRIVNFYIFSTMTSLCRHLSVVSTGNCKLSHDCRRVCSHRRRDSFVASALCSHRRHDATRQFRRVGIGGVYWT